MVGHKISGQHAVRLIKKWDRYVQARWKQGRPPCNVADHLSKFEREKIVKPARDVASRLRFSGAVLWEDDRNGVLARPGGFFEVTERRFGRVLYRTHSLEDALRHAKGSARQRARTRLVASRPRRDPSRLMQGRRLIATYPTRAAALTAAKRFVRNNDRPVDILTPSPSSSRSRVRGRGRPRTSRDADHPFVGEIFETKAGQRWEVVEVSDKLIRVRRKGVRPRSEGPFAWGRGVLKGLHAVPPGEAAKVKVQAELSQLSLFRSQGVNNDPSRAVRRDPSSRRRASSKVSKRPKKKPKKKSAGRRSEGAHCSNAPLLARKERTKPPPHTCPRSSKVQSLVFERYCWTAAKARSWASRHGYKTSKIDVTERFIRFRQLDPKVYKVVGTVPFTRGLNALMGCVSKKKAKRT
jgi:hypothetical protein